MKTIAIYSLIFVFRIQVGLACDCETTLIDLPIKEMGWTQTETDGISSMSDIIFSGILIGSRKVEETCQSFLFFEDKKNRIELTFKILKSFKGNIGDTVKIRTNNGIDACGFFAPTGTECLIFAGAGTGGYFYTYRSDCCKSISKNQDGKRYNKYIKFLESITNMIDGEYVIYQSKSYWNGGYRDTVENLEAIRYSIKDGKFEGLWQIKDRNGRILEKGEYINGQKVGTWEVVSYIESDLDGADDQIKIEKIKYRNSMPSINNLTIDDRIFNWGESSKKPYQTIRRQSVKKIYKYYDIKK